MKSAALRHYRRCKKGTWSGGIQEEYLGVKKLTIELNMANNDEHGITNLIFNQTSQVKGMCTFQVEARKELEEDIDEWTENGSGFIVTKIVRAYCTFVTYRNRFGGYQNDLPDDFDKNGRILSIVNTHQKRQTA